jgi:LysM repeat protein
MLRRAPSRRSLIGLLLAASLLGAVVTPVAAGDEWVVRPGDTLWDIAKASGTTVDQLVGLNRIANPALIHPGQRILLRAAAPAPAAPAPAPAATASTTHVVRAGDTLWAIASRYGTTVAAVAAANGIANPSFIRVGQQLVIPGATAAPPAAPTPAPAASASTVHVVQAGETLWAISGRYGVSVAAIATANQLANPSFIRVGQQLVIPGATASSAAPSLTNASMPPAMAANVAARAPMRDLLVAAANEFGVAPAFVLAVSWHESGWQPGAVSFAGAIGLMQLMPGTAQWVADSMLHEAPAPWDARWNARAGTRLLAFYLARYGGDKARTLAAYFQGMGSLEGSGILPSSRAYIDSILGLEAIFSR